MATYLEKVEEKGYISRGGGGGRLQSRGSAEERLHV